MKTAKMLLGVFGIILGLLPRTQGQTAPTNGLLAYYEFNGDVTDSSGNGNDGVNYGATFTQDRFGVTNAAIYFSNAAYVLTSFFPPLGPASRTVSGWFKVSSSAEMTFMFYGGTSVYAGDRFEPRITSQFAVDCSDGSLVTASNYANSTWHSFVVVVPTNAAVSNMIFYMDGIVQTNPSSDGPGNLINTATNYPLQFGELWTGQRLLTGALDDIRIYDHALSAGEVQQLYQYESTIPDTPTVIITAQPQSVTITNQGLASFTVTALSEASLAYQWQRNGTNLVDGGEVSGSGTSNLTVYPASSNDVADYEVIITNDVDSVTSSVVTLTLAPETAPTNGLLAYYKFDGDVTDASGNGNNGTNYGATFTRDRFGVSNAAIYFNNAAYVLTSFFPPLGTASRTFSGWFQVSSSANMTFMFYGGTGTYAGDRFEPRINSEFAVDCSNGSLLTASNYANSTWHSFVAVVPPNAAVSNMIFYMDGIVQTNPSSDGPGNMINTATNYPLQFGELWVGQRLLTGALDDVRVYDRALSASEVQQLYAYESLMQDAPIIITTQPQSVTITNRGQASFSVTVSSLASVAYQWQKNGTNLADGGEISGSGTSNLTLYPATSNDVANYAVIITNASGSATSSPAALTIVYQSALTNGLLAYYPFDGYANDASGNGNNGTNNGASFVLDRFGLANEAIYFTNNSVTTGFSPPLGKAARTISGWFDVFPGASQMTLLAYGDPVAAEQIALKINPGGQFDLDLSTDGLSTAGTYNDENWHSFVVIIPTNAAVSNVIVYLDDVLQTNLVMTGPGVVINTVTAHPLILGEYFNSLSPLPLTGALDDVRVYNRALSDAEVQLLYQLETTTPDAAPIIVQQPRSVTLTNGSSTNFSVAVSGLAPFAYQWQLSGTNLTNGNGISGCTTTNLVLNPATLGLAGSFGVIATNAYGSITSSVATLTVRTIFAWRAIASPQLVNLPITVSVLAENVTNGIATNFTGAVGLSASGGVAISPTNSGAFVNGVWTGKIKVPAAVTNLVLTAADSLGDVASANAFNVVAPPQLGVDASGGIALLLWPVVAPNTVVLTSTNLATTNWVPFSAQPVQIGNDWVVPLDMSNPRAFYRLRFSEP